jgi:anti-sigma factor RsiW
MSDDHSPVTEDELHAYVDGELPADRRAAVEAWLVSRPDEAARIAAWHQQAELLHARYDGIAEEPVPARLALDQLARGGAAWKRLAVAAAIAAFVLGGAAGWFGRAYFDPGRTSARTLTSEALDAHRLYVVEVRHPVEVPGGEEAHLVQWLSRRLNYEVRAPDLAALGLRLVGGRLLPGPAGAAAFFMYEGASGERFTLYCSRARVPETALRYSAAGQVAAFYWIEQEKAYVVSGPADRDRLLKVAQSAYDQLERRAATTAAPRLSAR